MSKAIAPRDAAHPLSRMDRESILAELQEVLASPHFCNSKRYPALLEYIVEKTLAGEADLLKERTLGVEVFDRPPSYDTNADTPVALLQRTWPETQSSDLPSGRLVCSRVSPRA